MHNLKYHLTRIEFLMLISIAPGVACNAVSLANPGDTEAVLTIDHGFQLDTGY